MHLSALSFEERSDLTLSSDYIDKVFQTAEQESLKAPNRKFAIRALLDHFSEFGVRSLEFFLIWRLNVGEGLSTREVAGIMGLSKSRIHEILSEIREDDFSDTGQTD